MLNELRQRLSDFGLAERGVCRADDDTQNLRDPQAAVGSIVLVGTVGSSLWPAFRSSAEFADGKQHALDRWSRRIGELVAGEFNATAIYPFGGPPYHPFMRWAKRAERMHTSPLGIAIHPAFGLWHAYRFALLFDKDWSSSPAEPPDICGACTAKPCLSTCPVDAFDDQSFDLKKCIGYLNDTPDAPCHQVGCVARNSCPHATAYRYVEEHAQFHMRAFFNSNLKVLATDG